MHLNFTRCALAPPSPRPSKLQTQFLLSFSLSLSLSLPTSAHRNGAPLRRCCGGTRADQPAHPRWSRVTSASQTVPTIFCYRTLDSSTNFLCQPSSEGFGFVGFVDAAAAPAMRPRGRRRAIRAIRRGRRPPGRSGSPGGGSASTAR